MKMSKEELQLYVKVINNQNNISMISDSELYEFKEIYQKYMLDKDCYEFLKKLSSNIANPSLQESMIDEYCKSFDLNDTEEEMISKMYNIDIRNIEYKRLANEKEIYKFYDYKLGRCVVLEKDKNGKGLKEDLKDIQEENEKYQTDNDERNANSIVNDQRINGNNEMEMIHIDDVFLYEDRLSALPDDQYKCLMSLLENKYALHIQYVNIENQFGISSVEYGSILYESVYSLEEDRVMIQQPEEFDYGAEEADVDITEEKEDQKESSQNGMFDIEENIRTSEEEKNLEQYKKYPELLEYLAEEERDKYIKMIEEDVEKEQSDNLEKVQEKTKEKVLVYKKEDKKNGYIDLIILSLVSGFTFGVFSTISFLIMK